MKTEIIDLHRIAINENNPRTITEAKFDQLVDSILSFPKMLSIRPIVVSGTYVTQGGNMRARALAVIATMDKAEIGTRLNAQASFAKKTPSEQKLLIDYWAKWQKKPMAEIVLADDLTEDELKEFLIKDNVGFGTWDFEMLANEWNESQLNEWGLDVWQPEAETDEVVPDKPKETKTCPHCGGEI